MNDKAMTKKDAFSTVRDLLTERKSQLAMALPRHLPPDRLIRVALTTFQKSPDLLACSKGSLVGAIMECAQLGLEPDGVLGHAYLVPFNNKGRKDAQLIVGYKGLIDLARRSGVLKSINAHVVREGDEFEFAYGLEPKLSHRPAPNNDGPIIAVYAVAHLIDGGSHFEVLWKSQVDAIRNQSRAGKSGPWVSHYEEMAKKTAIRRLVKYLPLSAEVQRAVALDERADYGIPQDLGVIEVEQVEATDDLDELAKEEN